jgi:aminocarboxymuconate-semialdehyde decarboxylase
LIIDVHAHLFPQSAVRAVEGDGSWHGSTVERGADGRPVITTGDYSVALGATEHWEKPPQRIERMDAFGVDMQVVSLNPIMFRYYLEAKYAIDCARDVNEEIASMAREWPTRFAGFATLPMQDVDAAVAELQRSVEELGLVGASIGTHVEGANFDEEHLYPVFEAAESLGALLFVHPAASRMGGALPRYHMRNYIGNPTETTIAIGSVIFGGLLDRLPDLKFCFAHGGGYACWGSARMDHGYGVRPEAQAHAAKLPSEYLREMYFDSLVHGYANLNQLIDTVGIDKVLLGSDYPADMGQPDPARWLEASPLTAEQKAAIGGDNAVRLLGDRIPSST